MQFETVDSKSQCSQNSDVQQGRPILAVTYVRHDVCAAFATVVHCCLLTTRYSQLPRACLAPHDRHFGLRQSCTSVREQTVPVNQPGRLWADVAFGVIQSVSSCCATH